MYKTQCICEENQYKKNLNIFIVALLAKKFTFHVFTKVKMACESGVPLGPKIIFTLVYRITFAQRTGT